MPHVADGDEATVFLEQLFSRRDEATYYEQDPIGQKTHI
jgi:hypothetical protein